MASLQARAASASERVNGVRGMVALWVEERWRLEDMFLRLLVGWDVLDRFWFEAGIFAEVFVRIGDR